MKARRYNQGKIRYELIPQNALKELAKVYTYGAHKYSLYKDSNDNIIKGSDIPIENIHEYVLIDDGANNWKKGLPWMSMLGSIERHIQAFKNGEDVDKDLNTLHLANAAWGLMGLLEYYRIYPQGDDRPHSYLNTIKYGLDIDGVLADFDLHLCNIVGIDLHKVTHWNDPIIKKYYNDIKHDENFWLTMPKLIKPEDIPFEVHCYITSRSIDTEITKKWLYNNGYPDAPVFTVGHNAPKVQVALESGVDIFIDDKFENFVQLNQAGICTFLMDAPHNQKHDVGYRRIFNFDNFK